MKMRFSSKAALATLALVIGSTLAVARTPQQGQPPDPSQDQADRHDRDRRGGMGDDGRMGRGMSMRPDGERGPRGGGEWGRGGPMGMRGGRMGMRGRGAPREGGGLARLLSNPEIRQQIGVSADQAAKIRQQESDFRKAEIRNRADLEIKRMDLRDLMSADKPDRAAIDGKLQEISAAQLTLEKAAVGHHLDMRDALTPAQRQKLEQWMRQRRERGPGNGSDRRGPQGEGQGGRGARGGRGAAAPPPPNAQGQPPKQ
jgi:Spy/CpxP family protein refolding chaperone